MAVEASPYVTPGVIVLMYFFLIWGKDLHALRLTELTIIKGTTKKIVDGLLLASNVKTKILERKSQMSKIDVSKIVSSVQKLYAKDSKAQAIISTGASVKEDYTDADVVPLPATHPLRHLSGLPGIPYNKIIQIAGKPDSGKSTMAAELMASAQKNGVQVILFDSEDKFDASRFREHFKGNPDDILMVKTNEILKGGEIVRKFITAVKEQDANAKILFVWDSVGGSQSRSHAERELDSEKHAQPGQDAKENGSMMKMLVALINKYPDSLAVYLANQTYAKIGFMQHGDAAAGGAKIEYHSSLIVMLKRIKVLTKVVKGITTKHGIITRATVTKNHLSQGKTSVHQLDFQITAEGAKLSDVGEVDDEQDEEA
jgi:RecA/RadA recombinase